MIALFDLDDTLLNGDSNHVWGRFLVQRGVLNGPDYEREQASFDRDYHAGTIDFRTYLRFTLTPLKGREQSELREWQEAFVREQAPGALYPQGLELVASHRQRGHTLLLVTATNRFFVEPFARILQMDALLASELEERDGRYTGRCRGEPCYREGKLARFRSWLAGEGRTGEECWFYSDSHNDIPLLEQVDHATAVNPDPTLRATAEQRGWPIVSFRGDS